MNTLHKMLTLRHKNGYFENHVVDIMLEYKHIKKKKTSKNVLNNIYLLTSHTHTH